MLKSKYFLYSTIIGMLLIVLAGCSDKKQPTSGTTKTQTEAVEPTSNTYNEQNAGETESNPESTPPNIGENKPLPEETKVVVLAIDDATIDWIKLQPPRFYSEEDKKQNPRDWYGFETNIRIQESLNKLVQPPSAIMWDYSFSGDGEVLDTLADLFNQSPSPLILDFSTRDNEEEFSKLNNKIYEGENTKNFNSNNCFWGHTTTLVEKSHTSIDQWYPFDIPEYVRFRSEDTRAWYNVTLPLSVAGFAGYLKKKMNLSKHQSLLYAESAGRCISEQFAWGGEDYQGIKVTKTNIETISALEFIKNTRDNNKNYRILSNSIIVVGSTGNLYHTDKHLYADGKLYPGVYFHAWTIKKLLDSWAKIKESECFKERINK